MLPIKKTLDRIPGGLMLVPLFLGSLVNTLVPKLPGTLGSFTEGLATGTVPILAVWFVCLGATISLRATGTVLRKSGTLLLTKLATAWLVAVVFTALVPGGHITHGILAGLSTLALVAAMDMTNTGLYASLMNQFGTKEEAGAFVLMNIESGPLMTLLVLGSTGLASFDPVILVGLILPFVLGYALGNLDPRMRDFLGAGVQPLIPFFAFALGCGVDLTVILRTGLLGIALGLAVIVITSIPLILCDIVIGRGNGTAGIAASSTAGAAVATPQLVAAVSPQFRPMAETATSLVATSLIVTSLVVPVITALWARNAHRIPLARRRPSALAASQSAAPTTSPSAAAAEPTTSDPSRLPRA
ncbi:2-keto-3-deoxygluconate permease [Brachybacterium sp. ACRRE]|uniref:2-keto-3-deoxygluconate permease n=1 Tax=Brachybacterium sp. ACRRE TaxID=2918184 RepID=UPI001EF1FAB8|nr:2-keto-3-deoxygluconate permease [Brachybacterium sp. ACRRE]MCG7309752.1 2-keto-3-deoxygluconate permease [Brachybacterium sp. ACRRE]